MPYLKMHTNVAIGAEQSSQLLTDFSSLLAKETGKPERYVMVELEGGKAMSFGGNADPLAYVECKSIGLSTSQAGGLSAAIADLLRRRLSLAPDRVYIEFSNCPAEFWGWNGSTFG
ncbi:phenylpyruvate tautomerase MIF-related protein [Methylomonas sp. SURF-2]|uniref:L-dopachrome isomerase n=1 Tax=Methylomonas subterranea TaxID=2952225 RepID=A0ABT1TBP2_9GAMM|nr:phenylpyruvate tautomerase MIF-related protein [Methylomonas sp. SURF-2]MCQ8102880.1 phenylpyruvate tautomerase MIF-related protein [Methylomonas sp. SURF-2]